MTRPQLPRFFIARADAHAAVKVPSEVATPIHIVDVFFVGHRHLEEREWAVAVDGFGNLGALPYDDRSLFSAALQNELAFHEVSANQPARLLEASDVFLFNLQLVEQPPGTPGWNDPVYLYGTLYGPCPASAKEMAGGVEGQLTVTRGDLLDGLVQGAAHAFRYAGLSSARDQVSRCFHLMLPGDIEDEVRRGAGLVLAYPLLPPELIGNDVSNEIVVKQLLYDLLSALKEDIATEQSAHPLSSLVLPVPSRHALEQQLKARGYSIEGSTATRKVEKGEGFKGLLASVFGSLMADRLELPPEGEAEDFLALARSALQTFPGWPSPRNVALRNCVKPAPTHRRERPAPLSPTVIKTPQPSSHPPPARVTLRTAAAASGEPPAWMQDFIAAHRQPDAPPPRLTSTVTFQQQEPEWQQDFAPPSNPQPSDKDSKKRNQVKAKWMEDFE